MPRMKPERMQEFLHAPITGVLATLRKNGMPYTVPVWWLWKPDGIRITGTYSRVWCKKTPADPRASLGIESNAPLSGHIEFDGHVTAVHPKDSDIWPISRELAEKYVGRGGEPSNAERVDAFFANMRTEPRLLLPAADPRGHARDRHERVPREARGQGVPESRDGQLGVNVRGPKWWARVRRRWRLVQSDSR